MVLLQALVRRWLLRSQKLTHHHPQPAFGRRLVLPNQRSSSMHQAPLLRHDASESEVAWRLVPRLASPSLAWWHGQRGPCHWPGEPIRLSCISKIKLVRRNSHILSLAAFVSRSPYVSGAFSEVETSIRHDPSSTEIDRRTHN